MKLVQTIKTSYDSLRKQKLRSILTMLAVAVGIGIVITVLSAGAGLEELVKRQLESFGSDLIEVEVKVPTTKHASVANAAGQAMGITITTLKLEDMEKIKTLPNVKNAYGMVIGQSLVSREGERSEILLLGVTSEAINIDKGIKLEKGRFFTEEEDKSLAQITILGSKVKEKLLGDSDALGESIKMGRKDYRVVGILKPRGAMMGFDWDNLIYVPLRTLQKKIMGIDHIAAMFAQVEDMKKSEITKEQIIELMREQHNIDDLKKDDFAVITMEEGQKMISKVFGGITLLLVALALISLLVGGVGIMNIMYVSVTERTYEIGLRKALGAKNGEILSQFLAETLLMTLFGGIAGIIGGFSITFSISLIAKLNNFDFPFVISFTSIFIGIIFSGIMGLFFGIYPAKKAAGLDPIVALTK